LYVQGLKVTSYSLI